MVLRLIREAYCDLLSVVFIVFIDWDELRAHLGSSVTSLVKYQHRILFVVCDKDARVCVCQKVPTCLRLMFL